MSPVSDLDTQAIEELRQLDECIEQAKDFTDVYAPLDKAITIINALIDAQKEGE